MKFKVGDRVLIKEYPSYGAFVVYRVDVVNFRCSVHQEGQPGTMFTNMKPLSLRIIKDRPWRRPWRRKSKNRRGRTRK